MAIIDWFSRYVLSWRLSNSLEVYFCIEDLEEALEKGNPDIFNTDQANSLLSMISQVSYRAMELKSVCNGGRSSF